MSEVLQTALAGLVWAVAFSVVGGTVFWCAAWVLIAREGRKKDGQG